MITLNEIEDAKTSLDYMIGRYLNQQGWKFSSSHTPGCYWMWMKEYKGNQIIVNQELALKMESILEQE